MITVKNWSKNDKERVYVKYKINEQDGEWGYEEELGYYELKDEQYNFVQTGKIDSVNVLMKIEEALKERVAKTLANSKISDELKQERINNFYKILKNANYYGIVYIDAI